MKQGIFTLEEVREKGGGIWLLRLAGDTSAITAPGQFVNIELPGKFLRRPISVHEWWEDGLELLVKEAGEGTRELVRLPAGTKLDVLTGLGNGFDVLDAKGKHAVLVSGGIGIAPFYGLVRCMEEAGVDIQAIVVGFASEEQARLLYTGDWVIMGYRVLPVTEDGSLGAKGLVTDVLKTLPDCHYVMACGPTPMLKAVHALPQITGGQFSFEARMACGFGACVGCSIPTKNGPRRVCKDGPVFRKEEIVW